MDALSHTPAMLQWLLLPGLGACLGGAALPPLRKMGHALASRPDRPSLAPRSHAALAASMGALAGMLCAACMPDPRLGVPALLLMLSLLALAWIDLETRLLPDFLTLPTLILGLSVNMAHLFASLPGALAGMCLGYALPTTVAWAYRKASGRNGLGGGDSKLAAALGAWLGWQSIPMLLLSASLLSIAGWGLLTILRGRPGASPQAFGPYLAAGGLISLLIQAR